MTSASSWCFTWSMSVIAGTHVCLRAVRQKPIWDALADHGVTHMCGAPIVLNILSYAPKDIRRTLPVRTKVMTGGLPARMVLSWPQISENGLPKALPSEVRIPCR